MSVWLKQLDKTIDAKLQLKIQAESVRLQKRAIALAGATGRHERYLGAKEFVQMEWSLHKLAYEGNKTDFADHYAPRVKNEFAVKVTHKTIRTSWLKGL